MPNLEGENLSEKETPKEVGPIVPSSESMEKNESPTNSRVGPFLSRFLTTFLGKYSDPENTNEEVLQAVEVIRRIGIGYCTDSGCAVETIPLSIEGKPLIKEAGVTILNRAGFLNYVEEEFQNAETARDHVAFEIVDIKDFRSCDMVRDGKGGNAAEIVLRRFSENLTRRAEELNATILQELGLKDAIVAVARYGGDEFSILFKNIPQEIPQNLPTEWQERCEGHTDFREVVRNYLTGEKINPQKERETDTEGIFKRGDNVIFENVRLKTEKSGAFEISEDPLKATIFWDRLRRGLVLRESEIDEYDSISKEQVDTISTRGMAEVKGNIADIVGGNPKLIELSNAVAVIASFIKDNSERDDLYRNFEIFLEKSVCDRLLSYNVETITSFVETDTEKPFKKIHKIEASGLKEVNDNLGLGLGDDVIVSLWDRFYNILHDPDNPDKEMKGVRFFRRGSMFFICETEESRVTENQIKRLHEIESVKVEKGNVSIELPVLTTTTERLGSMEYVSAADVKKSRDRLFDNEKYEITERLLYREMLKHGVNLLNSDFNLRDFVPSNEQISKRQEFIGLDNFFGIQLFNSNRIEERVANAVLLLDEMLRQAQSTKLVDYWEDIGQRIGISEPTEEVVVERLNAMKNKIIEASQSVKREV